MEHHSTQSELENVRAIAHSVDCLIEEDLAALGDIKTSTLDAYAKRGAGPDYVMFGNRRLYPRQQFATHLASRVRERKPGGATARDML